MIASLCITYTKLIPAIRNTSMNKWVGLVNTKCSREEWLTMMMRDSTITEITLSRLEEDKRQILKQFSHKVLAE